MGPYPQHKNNFTADVTSGVSGIWADCPFDEVVAGYHPGFAQRWDFENFKASSNVNAGEAAWIDGWQLFGDNGATVTLTSDPTVGTGTVAANAFGEVAIGSDGDNEGCGFRRTAAPFKFTGVNSTATARTGTFWMEARIQTSTITDTKHNIFLGLMEDTAITATVPITALGALADKNLIGFHRPESARTTAGTGGAIMNAVYKCDGVTAVSQKTDAATLVAATYIKLGLKYRPVEPTSSTGATFTWFVNGVPVSTKAVPTAAGTDFPNDILLMPVFHVLNATGTTPGTSKIDWLQVCQIPLVV